MKTIRASLREWENTCYEDQADREGVPGNERVLNRNVSQVYLLVHSFNECDHKFMQTPFKQFLLELLTQISFLTHARQQSL